MGLAVKQLQAVAIANLGDPGALSNWCQIQSIRRQQQGGP